MSVKKGKRYFFSEEQSVKVSTTLDAKRGSGKYISDFAPYGYIKSPEDKHKLVVDEYASQMVKRIFREYLSRKSIYKIAESFNKEGIVTPGVYIAMQEKNESQLAKYREKKHLRSNVAVGRILSNEQYTGTMVYNRFKSKNVGDKHATKALPAEEWKRVENCHVAIISREDFEKVAAMRKGNTCVSVERKHKTHSLTGKVICGNCAHRLAHSYAGRPKYCTKYYLDKADSKCNISVLDATMEEVVMKHLQLFIDMWVDSRKIVDMQRKKQAHRLALAEKHLVDMETSNECLNKDLRDACESYKLGMTDKETYLEQKKIYEQLLQCIQENIEK